MEDVATPSKLYNQQATKRQLTVDLIGGTQSMRDAGERWLPREEKEPDRAYKARLGRSILLNTLRDTIDKISSRPFAQPIQTDQDNINVDLMGSKLTQFANSVLKSAITYGRSHVLVDMPRNQGATLATEGEAFFKLLETPDIIKWEDNVINGERLLTSVTILETPDRVRTITATDFAVYERQENAKAWTLTDSGTHTYGAVPIVTLQLSDGWMSATPMFEDLAWLNLAHWQSYSDHRNILRVARVPLLMRVGFTASELKTPVVLGPTNVLSSVNPDAKCEYVEHSGKAIEAGFKDLDRLEKQMQALGMQPLVSDVERTAKEVTVDNDRSLSEAQVWAEKLQTAMIGCYKMRAQWKNRVIEPKLSVFMDFNLGSADADMILRAASAGLLSQETFLNEWQRRGLVSESLNIKDEIAKLTTIA